MSYSVITKSQVTSDTFELGAKLTILENLKKSAQNEIWRINSFKRCPELENELALPYQLADQGFFFLCKSWRQDSDCVIVCAFCFLPVFLDLTSDSEKIDIELLKEHHSLKSIFKCSRIECTSPYIGSEARVLKLPYLDVYLTDYTGISLVSALFARHTSTLSIQELKTIDKNTLCKNCGISMISIVFLPCRHSYLCLPCAVNRFKCEMCKKPVKGQTFLFLG
jgi:hypothetical protein